MIKRRNNILALLCLLTSFVYSQESEGSNLLSKMADYYSNQNSYAMELEYKMFRGYDKDSLTEHYTTSIFKQDELMKMTMDAYDMYVFEDFQVTISEKNKTIYINDKSIESNPAGILQTFNALKETCDITIVSKTTKVVELSLKPKDLAKFTYSKVDTKIGLPNYNMISQTLYFKKLIPFKDQNGVVTTAKGCMEVNVKKHTDSVLDFPQAKEIVVKSQDNSFIAASKYSGYQLIDQRAKK